ncbi:glycosyltransferase [Patescibacteria group bacterium]|nr:glycosyltransferase [Patescibacteria group bacterium]MBU1674066.1 glycosyltransferase [Patescibacteria group bacterium]MBU1963785.1 glycosyltransferase [Patescibacteria group bacterium]
MFKLSIIIPAYNEGERIKPTLDDYCNYFKDDTEIIIVVNNCTDNTEDIVKACKKKYSNLRYIVADEPDGKGGAVMEGFKVAKGEVIGFVDADNATTAKEYDKLYRALGNNDGVIASRYRKDSEISERSIARKLASIMFRVFVKMMFWMPYSDTQCGAKLFNRKLTDFLIKNVAVENMAFDVEILYKAKKNGFKVIEAPTIWIDKEASAELGSPVKLAKNGIKMLLTLFKIRF